MGKNSSPTSRLLDLAKTADVVAASASRKAELSLPDTFLQSETQLLERPFPPSLVDNLFVAGSLIMLVSQPGIGKTFTAIDLSLSIASGQSMWLGQLLRIQGPVIYGVGEGAGRFKLREMAWKQHHHIIRTLPFYWTDGPIDLLDDKMVTKAIAEFNAVSPKLIVFDTLSRSIAGADENDHASMSKAIANLDQMRRIIGATVLVLHHTNASGTRERGHSAFKGAIDSMVWLEKVGDNGFSLESIKQKDLDDFSPISVALRTVTLDGLVDPLSGLPVKSAVIELGNGDGDIEFTITNSLDTKGCMSRKKLAKELGKRPETVNQAVNTMIDEGGLVETGTGTKTKVCLPTAA